MRALNEVEERVSGKFDVDKNPQGHQVHKDKQAYEDLGRVKAVDFDCNDVILAGDRVQKHKPEK